jgi:transposase
MANGRAHSREFKLMVMREIVNGEVRPAQVCREHTLSESLLLRWRREYAARGEAAFTPDDLTGPDALQQRIAELECFCEQLALENAVRKNGARQLPLAERHAMIAAAHLAHPDSSLHRLCELFGVGRTWYYTHPTPEETAQRDVVQRAAIEDIVLAFPGHGFPGYPNLPAQAGGVSSALERPSDRRVLLEPEEYCKNRQPANCFSATGNHFHMMRCS